MKVTFITSRPQKLETARKAFEGTGITILNEDLDTPEIQSTEVEEIAKYSAMWAANKLRKPIVVNDLGYYIEALNGFPGPFIKFINKWLTATDILRLMEGKTNRRVVVKECLAYCEPGSKPATFLGTAKGTLAEKPGRAGWIPIDEIFIPDGFNRPQSEIPRKQIIEFWNKSLKIWQKLAKYLKTYQI